jgi:hypothetical protein
MKTSLEVAFRNKLKNLTKATVHTGNSKKAISIQKNDFLMFISHFKT